jgi:hypothetical protein
MFTTIKKSWPLEPLMLAAVVSIPTFAAAAECNLHRFQPFELSR